MHSDTRTHPPEIYEISAAIQDKFKSLREYILSNSGKNKFTIKADNSQVTEADIEVEKRIISHVSELFPDVNIYGEESTYDPNDLPGTYWLIDPIDGTSSYIEGTATFTCMAVCISGERAVASIVYNPTSDEMYTAFRGEGARKNGNTLDLTKTLHSNIGLCKGRFVEAFNETTKEAVIVHQTGSSGAGYEFSLVAEGVVSVIYKLLSGGQIHDYATGALLISEAGGSLIPILDSEYTYRTRSFVACHPDLADIIIANIDKIRALEDPTLTAL